MMTRSLMYGTKGKFLALMILLGLIAPLNRSFAEMAGLDLGAGYGAGGAALGGAPGGIPGAGGIDPNKAVLAIAAIIEQNKLKQATNAGAAAQQEGQAAQQMLAQAGQLDQQAAACAQQQDQGKDDCGGKKKHHRANPCAAISANAADLRQRAGMMAAAASQNFQNAQRQQEHIQQGEQVLGVIAAVSQNGGAGQLNAILPVLALAMQQPPPGAGNPTMPPADGLPPGVLPSLSIPGAGYGH